MQGSTDSVKFLPLTFLSVMAHFVFQYTSHHTGAINTFFSVTRWLHCYQIYFALGGLASNL